MTDPLEHIRRLAQEIGPRPSTGEGERRAAAYIAERFEGFGYTVKTEAFRAPASFGYAYMVTQALVLAGFVAGALDRAAIGLLLAGVGVVAFLGENTTALRIAALVVPRGRSQNVVARLAPRNLPRRRLVLCAHYDSTRSGLMWHPRLVRSFRLTFFLVLAAMLAVALLDAAEAVTKLRLFWYASIPFAAIVLYAFGLLVHRELAFEHVPGANDNASGVAVMLSLGEALAMDAPADTEVVAVATGCEESGLWGMQSFLNHHKDELQRAWIINVDNVGAGKVFCTSAEGMLLRHKSGREISEVAKSVAGGLGVGSHGFRLMSTDAEPALVRGYDAISLMAAGPDGVPLNWHWKTDTYENVDPDSVDTAYRLLEAMVRRLIA